MRKGAAPAGRSRCRTTSGVAIKDAEVHRSAVKVDAAGILVP